nr:unnamed protein product [Callosobruchus chinensis]
MGEQTSKSNKFLSICHLNVRSLLSDFDRFAQLINNKFNIAAITETWLNSDIDDSTVSTEGYQLFLSDRGSRGGGVAIYYRSHRRCTKVETNIPTNNLLELLCCKFKVTINEPTRITQHSLTLIDPIFISNPNIFVESGTINADHISDHRLVFCKLRIKTAKHDTKYISYRDFKNIDIAGLRECLKRINLDQSYYLDDINTKARITKTAAPWLTPNLERILNERDSALQTFRCDRSVANWLRYKDCRNYALAFIRRGKKAYLSQCSHFNN